MIKRTSDLRGLKQGRQAGGFTLIEVLVVVAIIALLIAILMPSLKKVRQMSMATMCGQNIRTVTQAGTTWMLENRTETVPANQGWVHRILKVVQGNMEVFRCPAAQRSMPLPPLLIRQPQYRFTAATDSGYFSRSYPDSSGAYTLKFETELDSSGGDADFDDATIYVQMASDQAKMADVWATKGSTGRKLDLLDWRGKTLVGNFSTTPHLQVPVLWGGLGMNLSAAYGKLKPWHALYAEYNDWSIVTESRLRVRTRVHELWNGQPLPSKFRADCQNPSMPDFEQFQARHMDKGNVGFLDTHVELMTSKRVLPVGGWDDESKDCLWHPQRPGGWAPPKVITSD